MRRSVVHDETPEMYSYARQVLETMKQYSTDLDDALGIHAGNMTRDELREIVAERPSLQKASNTIREIG